MQTQQIHRCPNCGSERFSVTAHVAQEWEVDKNGCYVSAIQVCTDIVHMPDNDDLWSCLDCGHEDAGKAFLTNQD